MRVVKDPDERKQEILNAAIRVFARKGYDKTSISDIAKEIGISQGLCYRYFPSKEAVYDAGIDEYAEYIVNLNVKKANVKTLSLLPLKEQILIMSGRMGEYESAEHDKKDLYELFHKEGNQRLHNELFLKVGQKLIPYMAQELKIAKERGEIQIDDPEATAYFFVFGQMGILMSKNYTEEQKTSKIQQCLFELLGIKE